MLESSKKHMQSNSMSLNEAETKATKLIQCLQKADQHYYAENAASDAKSMDNQTYDNLERQLQEILVSHPSLTYMVEHSRVVLTPLLGYNRWADLYDAYHNPLVALEERSQVLSPSLLNNKRVLDAGCGTGRWLLKAAAAGAAKVVGLDFSPRMLAQARQNLELLYAEPNLGNTEPTRRACVQLLQLDLTQGAWDVGHDEKVGSEGGLLFDVCVSSLVLEHLSLAVTTLITCDLEHIKNPTDSEYL